MQTSNPCVAIDGYDVVEYFKSNKAKRGSGLHVAEFNGQDYLFGSEENQKAFEKDPEKYLPQFNGWCSFGCSVGKKFHVNPENFEIVDGKLHLFLDSDIQSKWDEDPKSAKQSANKNWADIKHKKPAEL